MNEIHRAVSGWVRTHPVCGGDGFHSVGYIYVAHSSYRGEATRLRYQIAKELNGLVATYACICACSGGWRMFAVYVMGAKKGFCSRQTDFSLEK